MAAAGHPHGGSIRDRAAAVPLEEDRGAWVGEALRADPNDTDSRQALETAEQALTLDPTPRGLAAAERFHRTERILRRALERLQACAVNEAALPSETRDAMHAAQASLARPRRPPSYGDAAEANLALASRIWTARLNSCASRPGAGDALAAVIGKIDSR